MTNVSGVNDMSTSAVSLAILESELKRLRDGAFESWKIYMSWYTWFFGANLIVLGWILTKPNDAPKAMNCVVLAAIWVFFNLAAVGSTLRLRTFTLDVAERAKSLSDLITEEARRHGVPIELTSGFAGEFGRWGVGANAFSLAVNVLVWSYVGLTAVWPR